jgi:hypothetical protein
MAISKHLALEPGGMLNVTLSNSVAAGMTQHVEIATSKPIISDTRSPYRYISSKH